MENNLLNIKKHGMSRREFLWLASMSAVGVTIGCETSPITGELQFLLISEDSEIRIDKQHSPHQLSADYGTLQDKTLSGYIDQTGRKISTLTHRPHMPYSFHGVNATYVNAYAFPGGTIAATRGILLALEDEAELAALLGHELGHVNARHTAQRMSRGVLANLLVSGVAAYIRAESAAHARLASKIGMIGAGALLASYNRDDEREADALGLEYMVRAGYNPKGLVELMDMLRNMSKRRPNVVELMFATHPMSDERYRAAVKAIEEKYRNAQKYPLHKERYMDYTVRLRAIRAAIEEMQNGEREMARERYRDAEIHFQNALKQAPEDYAGLLMMSKCQMAQGRYTMAQRYIDKAKLVYPEEAQAYHLSGFAKIKRNNYDSAYEEFIMYEKLLPGNPNTIFFKGLSLEGMQRFDESAKKYYRYLQLVRTGAYAKHAYRRLVEWGYIKP